MSSKSAKHCSTQAMGPDSCENYPKQDVGWLYSQGAATPSDPDGSIMVLCAIGEISKRVVGG